MNKKLVLLACAIAALACAAPPFSFQTHYLPLGTGDTSVAIVADAAGNIFIVSNIASNTGPVRVTKTDPSGKVIAVMSFGEKTGPYGAAVDPQGNLFVVCFGLIAKLDNGLTRILATSPIGGTAITTDAAGNVWVAGTAGADFPTTPGAYQSNPPPGAFYAFVAELSPDLATVMHATLYGSSSADCNPISDLCRGAHSLGLPAATYPTAIALDPSGAVVIAGYSNGQPAKLFLFPYNYAFVAKFSRDLTSLLGAGIFNPLAGSETYFFGTALDSQGNILLVGNAGPYISLPGGTLQSACAFEGAGIILKLNSALTTLLWGTFFGGAPFGPGLDGDAVRGVSIDSRDNVWVTGLSQEYCLPNSTSTSFANLPYIAELTPDGSVVLRLISSQFGGQAISLTPNDGFAVLGPTDSFLLTAPPDQPALLMVANSANNQSSGTIAPAELISLFGMAIGPASPIGGQVVNGAFTTSLGGYQVLFNGVPAPLLYAGLNQMNVVSPAAIANQQSVDIEVAGPGGTVDFPTVYVAPARPQIFSQQFPVFYGTSSLSFAQAFPFAVANNQDGGLNSNSNPALDGSIVTIWATGMGLTGEPLPDGAIVGSGSSVNLPIITYSGEVLYAGQAPGAIQGLTQINLRIPPNVHGPQGNPFQYGISLQLNGALSGTAFIAATTK